MIDLEKNILRMLKITQATQVPELSDWNAVGISHDEAKIIAYRNKLNLKILKSSFLPSFRVFEFKQSLSKVSIVSLNEPMQKGGER